jgi:peptidoglycan/xylan/chitin deacetylase (PgdA/CDA1 family)
LQGNLPEPVEAIVMLFPFPSAMLRVLPLSFYLRVFRGKLTALFYHAVGDRLFPHVQHLFRPFSEDEFEGHLCFLKRHYQFIDYDELVHHCASGSPLPPGVLHLSFDDGYSECHSVVIPLLLKHRIPCVFFISTDWIDNTRMFYRNKVSLLIERLIEMEREGRGEEGLMRLGRGLSREVRDIHSAKKFLLRLTWADEQVIDCLGKDLQVDFPGFLQDRRPYLSVEQIRQMVSEGFVIGAHSRSHLPLSQLGFEVAKREVIDSVQIVREITGTPEIPFSFPFSGRGLDFERVCSIRRDNPFVGLFFDSGGVGIEKSCVVKRVWAEAGRNGNAPPTGSLPQILQRAYVRAAENFFQFHEGR